ncbi:MAG: SDR family NAD(P)-dependent oxidoreductase, partial [Advenella sp.]
MKNMLNLDGKTVLVTGAAGGLGTHFSETLGAAGARVVLAGRRQAPLQALSGKLTDLGIENLPVVMDATDPDSVCGAFDQIHRVFGVVDVVVCNAGLGINKKSLALSVDEFIEVIDVNLKGSWIVANETARRLIAADRQGSVIMITSILGHRVAGAVLPYTTSKAALEQMTKALALE